MPLDYDYSTVDYIIRRRLHIRGPTNLIAGCANANHLSTVLTSDQTMATRSFNHSYWWTVAVALVCSVINTILSWSSLSGPQCLRKVSVMFSKLTWERAYQSSRSPFDDLHFSLKAASNTIYLSIGCIVVFISWYVVFLVHYLLPLITVLCGSSCLLTFSHTLGIPQGFSCL